MCLFSWLRWRPTPTTPHTALSFHFSAFNVGFMVLWSWVPYENKSVRSAFGLWKGKCSWARTVWALPLLRVTERYGDDSYYLLMGPRSEAHSSSLELVWKVTIVSMCRWTVSHVHNPTHKKQKPQTNTDLQTQVCDFWVGSQICSHNCSHRTKAVEDQSIHWSKESMSTQAGWDAAGIKEPSSTETPDWQPVFRWRDQSSAPLQRTIASPFWDHRSLQKQKWKKKKSRIISIQEHGGHVAWLSAWGSGQFAATERAQCVRCSVEDLKTDEIISKEKRPCTSVRCDVAKDYEKPQWRPVWPCVNVFIFPWIKFQSREKRPEHELD